MTLEATIEAVLFWRAEPVAIKQLASDCQATETAVREALIQLEAALAGRGLCLIRKDEEVLLATAPTAGPLLEKLAQEELAGELGRAGLETVSLVLYRAPITRAEIDYIRGVNSSFILRHLQIRGLVEKIADPADSRRFLYRPTFDLLRHLGLTKLEDLPEQGTLKEKLAELNQHDDQSH